MKWKIHHVTLQTHDVAQSDAFYHDILGLDNGPTPTDIGRGSMAGLPSDKSQFTVVGEHNRGVHLSRPLFGFARQTGMPVNPGMGGHLAISVENIAEVKKRLDAAGIFYADAGTYAMPNVQQIYLYDPSGNMLEINEDPKTDLADWSGP